MNQVRYPRRGEKSHLLVDLDNMLAFLLAYSPSDSETAPNPFLHKTMPAPAVLHPIHRITAEVAIRLEPSATISQARPLLAEQEGLPVDDLGTAPHDTGLRVLFVVCYASRSTFFIASRPTKREDACTTPRVKGWGQSSASQEV